jgi:hypothetical protein
MTTSAAAAAVTHFEIAKSLLAIAQLDLSGDHLDRCREECQRALKAFEHEPGNPVIQEVTNILERADELETGRD